MKRLVRASRLPRWRYVALLAGVAMMVVGWGSGSAAGDRAAPRSDLVTIGPAVGITIPWGFVGVSLEYSTVSGLERPGRDGADPVLAQLIRNLAPEQTPVLRIGGDSTDWTWWPVRGVRRLPGLTRTLTPAWLADARALQRTSHARLILGLNLEADNPKIAATEAGHLLAGIGRSHIEALEIGNEPELYSGLPWYHTPSGQKRFGRPPTYGIADYTREFASFAAVLPQVPLAGPSTGSRKWISGLGSLIAAAPGLRLVTYHGYGLNPRGLAYRGHNCSTAARDQAHPTVPGLLASSASLGLIPDTSAAVALAHSHRLHFRVDEMNAITCAGTPGVSDTFASALWALNAMFALASEGVDGVNVHTYRGSDGKLFDVHLQHRRWVGTVAPEYYGLLTFAQAAPPGSRLLHTVQTGSAELHSWALTAPDHSLRVVLVNDSMKDARSVVVRAPGAGRRAELQRLLARSAYAQRGMTLGGQSFGNRTTTGELSGSPRVSVLRPSGDEYSVSVPAASAAVLTIS